MALKPRWSHRWNGKLGIFGGALAIMQAAWGQPTPVHWYVGLDPAHPSQALVQVDTRDLPSNADLRDVTVYVGYLDASGDLIGGSSLAISDASHPALLAGHVYVESFPMAFPQATRLVGYSLHSSYGASGQLYEARMAVSKSGAVRFGYPSGPAADAGVRADGAAPIERLSTPSARTRALDLPGSGIKNENRTIGPFCCTGETATVRAASGQVVGYVYAFGFSGGVNLPAGLSAARTVEVMLSGEPPGGGAQVISRAEFSAASWHPGSVVRVQAGQLTYVVTLTGADVVSANGQPAFYLGSLRAHVEVQWP